MGNLMPAAARLFVRTHEAKPVDNAPLLIETGGEAEGYQHQLLYSDDLHILEGPYTIYPVCLIQLC